MAPPHHPNIVKGAVLVGPHKPVYQAHEGPRSLVVVPICFPRMVQLMMDCENAWGLKAGAESVGELARKQFIARNDFKSCASVVSSGFLLEM